MKNKKERKRRLGNPMSNPLLDETRDDYLLVKALRETMYNPPEYKARPEPDYETCERVMKKGMYAGQKCHGKREKQLENGKWYCEKCSKMPKGFL